MNFSRDLSPLSQRWVQEYADQLMTTAERMEDGPMKEAALRRAEAVSDLLESWQKRRWIRYACTECGARYDNSNTEYCINPVVRDGKVEPCGGKVRMV